MKYAFQKMQLEAPGFFDLIGTWAEMQLVVTKDSAVIIGELFCRQARHENRP